MSTYKEPFSFNEITAEPQIEISNPSFFRTSDNINLAHYKYQPDNTSKQALIFLHGGGACSSLGYQYLAETLSRDYDTSVYLFDMRGHGLSEGRRGDAPNKERIWLDISEFITFIQEEIGNIPLYLGGHSSGGGLVLNYASWENHKDLSGYIFIAPKLGYKSNSDRHSFTNDPFVKAYIGRILVNKLSNGNLNSHAVAVEMNYSQELLKAEPLIVDKYTCAVVNAITPGNPKKQFRIIDKPFYLCIGLNDELMLPENTIDYIKYANDEIAGKSLAEIIQEQNHLGILRVAGELIGNYLGTVNGNKEVY